MAYEKVKIGQTVDENNQIINNNFDESVNIADKGIPDGIATLDSSGKVPSAQLPDIPMTAKDIKMTGYVKPSVTSAIVPADSADAAIGKLERKADDHGESLIQAVIQMSGNIAGLSTSITKANNDILDINTDVNQLRTDTDSNKADIGVIETNINGLNGRVNTLEQGKVIVDTTLDINSNNAIANKVAAAKFIDINGTLQDLINRIIILERNSVDMLITTTETANTLTIQTNPLDTLFYAMTVYGKTTQIGTPSPDNPTPIFGAVNPVITVSDGTKTPPQVAMQSVTLDGITLNSIDAASLIDTIEIDTVANSGVDKVTLTHKVAMMTDLNLFSIYPSGSTTTHTSIYIPTNEYLLGTSNVLCNLLPNTDIGDNGYITTAIAQNRIFINNVPNALTGINGGDTNNNKANALKTWLLARGIKILYVPKEATVTDITETPLGQALLGLRAYKGTTVIQFSNGATGNITYNRSANATIAELSAAVNAIIDGD